MAADFKEFFHAKSMLTPGIAGSVTMMVSNVLFSQFDLPQKYTGLVLSFILAFVVMIGQRDPLWQRIPFFFINGLVIFSVAIGTNAVGSAVTKAPSAETVNLVPAVPVGHTGGPVPVTTNTAVTNIAVRPGTNRIFVTNLWVLAETKTNAKPFFKSWLRPEEINAHVVRRQLHP